MEAATPPPFMILAVLPKPNTNQIEVSNHHQYNSTKRSMSASEVVEEVKQLLCIALPMIATGLLLYGRSAISMLFLGRLGKDSLAGGALAIGFANMTGYSVLAGLGSGMEPVSTQAFGARRRHLIGLALQRTSAILLTASVVISFLWLHSRRLLLLSGQHPTIATAASSYLMFSLPTLFIQSFINPLKIFLRSQNITFPLTLAAGVALLLHAPINHLLISRLGFRGVALAACFSDCNFLITILVYVYLTGLHHDAWTEWSPAECFREWQSLLSMAVPSCIAVCLEWWWYELMIVFSGLLPNATDSVAAMGILIQTTSLVYVFPSSLGLAVSTRVGNELGAGRPHKARAATRVALALSVAIGITAALLATSLRHAWGRAFTADEAVVALTAAVMPVVGLCEIGNCPQTTGCGALRGSARPGIGAQINLGSFYGVGMPVAMVMGLMLNIGLLGLWVGLAAAQGTCAVLMAVVLARTDWAAEGRRARELTGGDDQGSQVYDAIKEEDEVGNLGSRTVLSSSITSRLYEEDGKEIEALISVEVLK